MVKTLYKFMDEVHGTLHDTPAAARNAEITKYELLGRALLCVDETFCTKNMNETLRPSSKPSGTNTVKEY